jgi:hypothetical protein
MSIGVARTSVQRLTSSSFSGLPFKPPLGSWRSEIHQARVGVSTRSNRSRIASAATQTKTEEEESNMSIGHE